MMKCNVLKSIRAVLLLLTSLLSLPVEAQDFGHPSDKAFYKAHWNEIVADQEYPEMLTNAQYVLFDFDKDGRAELYLRCMGQEYLYTMRDGKAVRVSDGQHTEDGRYSLVPFYPHFMAPCQMLLDKPVPEFTALEQQVYDMTDVPHIWFGLHPVVNGAFTLKNVADAVCCFDCYRLDDLLYTLATGSYSDEDIEEYVMDAKSGYARAKMRTPHMNMLEMCYWNLTNGEKLLAVHYHLSEDDGSNGVNWFEQTLFMKYDPTTKRLNPVVAPIEGFDFMTEYNFSLPRKGLNIKLIGAEDHELKWTGSGFRY